jgi:predicted HTH domain antitoxin
MQTVTLQVTLPKKLLAYGLGQEEVNREVGKCLVFSLFRAARVSSGKAASLLGMTRREFLELLHQEGIAYFDYSEEDLQTEFASVRELPPAGTE